MNKYLKYSLIGIGAVIICLGLFFGWRFYSNVKREVKPAISVVPNDVNVLLRVNNTADFLSYLGRQHENIASLLDLNQSGLNTTILNDLKELNTQIKLGEFWMSTHIRGRQTQYLFAINVESIQQVALEKYLKKLSDNKEQIVPLFDIEETPVYGTFTSGILIVSPYKSLIDEALLQLSSDQNLLHDEALQRVLKTAGKNTPANLFIQVPELVKNLEKETKSDYAALIQAFALFSKWIEYDLIEREENTMLSGYAVQNRSQLFFLDLISHLSPKTPKISNFLPSTTRFFLNFNVSDFSEFYESFLLFLDNHGQLSTKDSLLENISEGLSVLSRETFQNWIGHEFSYFAFLDGHGQMRKAVAFEYSNLDNTIFQLERLINYDGSDRRIKSLDLIYRVYAPYLLPNSFFSFFPKSQAYYFSRIGTFVFFADNEETLLNIRMFFDQQKVLSKTIRMHNFSEQLQEESNLDFYVQDLRMLFQNAPNVACGLQFNGRSSVMYAHAYLQSNLGRERQFDQLEIAPRKATPEDRIRKNFKGNVLKGPYKVNNHRINKPFYILQDDKFALYYLDSEGKVQWRYPLAEALESSIFEIDFYKNNKIQYLFNTQNRLYLLDIYGRHVEDYPIRFKIPAKGSIEVTDPQNNKDYRISFINADDVRHTLNKQARKI